MTTSLTVEALLGRLEESRSLDTEGLLLRGNLAREVGGTHLRVYHKPDSRAQFFLVPISEIVGEVTLLDEAAAANLGFFGEPVYQFRLLSTAGVSKVSVRPFTLADRVGVELGEEGAVEVMVEDKCPARAK